MFALVLAAWSAGGVGLGGAAHDPLIEIAFTVYQGDPLGSEKVGTVQVLSSPTVGIRSGQPGYVRSGTDVEIKQPDGKAATEQVGTAIEVVPVVCACGTTRVEMSARLREVNPGLGITTAAGFVPGFTEQSVRTAWIVKPGETTRHRIAARSAADQTWVEVAVRPIK